MVVTSTAALFSLRETLAQQPRRCDTGTLRRISLHSSSGRLGQAQAQEGMMIKESDLRVCGRRLLVATRENQIVGANQKMGQTAVDGGVYVGVSGFCQIFKLKSQTKMENLQRAFVPVTRFWSPICPRHRVYPPSKRLLHINPGLLL